MEIKVADVNPKAEFVALDSLQHGDLILFQGNMGNVLWGIYLDKECLEGDGKKVSQIVDLEDGTMWRLDEIDSVFFATQIANVTATFEFLSEYKTEGLMHGLGLME